MDPSAAISSPAPPVNVILQDTEWQYGGETPINRSAESFLIADQGATLVVWYEAWRPVEERIAVFDTATGRERGDYPAASNGAAGRETRISNILERDGNSEVVYLTTSEDRMSVSLTRFNIAIGTGQSIALPPELSNRDQFDDMQLWAVTPDGQSVWIGTNDYRRGPVTLWKVDLRTGDIQQSGNTGVYATSGGTKLSNNGKWFVASTRLHGNSGTVSLIRTKDLRVKTIDPGGYPTGVAISGGQVWVCVRKTQNRKHVGAITRIRASKWKVVGTALVGREVSSGMCDVNADKTALYYTGYLRPPESDYRTSVVAVDLTSWPVLSSREHLLDQGRYKDGEHSGIFSNVWGTDNNMVFSESRDTVWVYTEVYTWTSMQPRAVVRTKYEFHALSGPEL